MASSERGNELANDCGQLSQGERDEFEASNLVDKLWGLNSEYDIPVVKVFGTTVTDADIQCLRGSGWLTDNMLTTQQNDLGRSILQMISSTLSAVMDDNGGSWVPVPGRNNQKSSSFDMVIGAYHRSSHWTLLIVEISSSMVYFYNPTGENQLEMDDIISSWSKFIEGYTQRTNDLHMPSKWTIQTKPLCRQTDGFNCGVYCLIFAEKRLIGSDNLDIDADELKQMRKHIATKFMLFEGERISPVDY